MEGRRRDSCADGGERRGRRNVVSERENYVSWWRERTPGRLSWAHASLVLLGREREDLSLSRGTGVASVDTRETRDAPRDRVLSLVTVAVVPSHERNSRRKSRLGSSRMRNVPKQKSNGTCQRIRRTRNDICVFMNQHTLRTTTGGIANDCFR